jgi:cleavage and polyadenylation specificity factor subunit 1
MPQTSDFLGGASQSPESDYMDMDGSDADSPQPLHQILHTSQSGTLALITPLSESSYKRLSDLATFLSNSLDSACGLNARAFRAVEADGAGASVGGGQGSVGASRSMVDGNLLMRWGELGEQRRRDGMGKVGGDEWVFRGEREVLIGRGIFGSRG